MADLERKRTYEAEWAIETLLARGGTANVHGARITVPVERRFGSLDHVQVFVDHVVSSAVVADRYGAVAPISVRHRKGNAKAHYNGLRREIAVNDPEYGRAGWAMRETVIVHEIAHALAPCGHTAEFRRANVFLHEEFIGPEAGWLLWAAYLDAGLAVAPA